MQSCVSGTGGWLQQRNFAGRFRSVEDLSQEAFIYLLVTLVVHPDRLPSEALTILAERFFGFYAEGSLEH